jgi:citronellol/citronellal dehydrogenase
VFSKPSRELTGRFLIDDTFLAETGVTDFDQYRVDPTQKLAPDFFVPESIAPPKGVSFEAVSAAARYAAVQATRFALRTWLSCHSAR